MRRKGKVLRGLRPSPWLRLMDLCRWQTSVSVIIINETGALAFMFLLWFLVMLVPTASSSKGAADTRFFSYGHRTTKMADGSLCGVAGTVEELSDAYLSSQPICAFDWSPDRLGLFCCAALDQCLRVGIVTRLQSA